MIHSGSGRYHILSYRKWAFEAKEMPERLAVAFVSLGFVAITGQIVLMRELLVVFGGNELSAAVVLAFWLIWTAAGSALLGRISDRLRNKVSALALFQVLLALALPFSLLAVRWSRVLLGISVGVAVDPVVMALVSFTFLAPFCVLSGFLFALACSLAGEVSSDRLCYVGRIFLLEAAGAGLGGLSFTFLFVTWLSHMQIALFTAGLLTISACSLLTPADRGERRVRRIWPCGVILAGLAWVGIMRSAGLEQVSRSWEWPGYQLLATRETPYGHLAAVSRNDQISFFENGILQFAYPDPLSAEESVHYALLEHPEPKKVLLLGGGLSGSLNEVLKHPSVLGVDYVELDPGLIELGKSRLPADAVQVLARPEVRLIHEDGRRFVQSGGREYDVLIVNLPDPITAQLNRFYTVDFFQEAKRVLRPGGLLSFALTSSENIIGPTLAQLLKSIERSLMTVFEDVLILTGGQARFFASGQKGVLVENPQVLVDRIRERGLNLQFVRDYYLLFNLSAARQSYFQQILAAAPETKLNLDLNPSCYLYNLVHWSAQHTPTLKSVFLILSRIEAGWFILSAVLASGVFWALARRTGGANAYRWSTLYLCFVAGYTGMALTVLLLLSFQALFGSVYYRVALLFSSYMVGLVWGAAQVTSLMNRIHCAGRALIMVQVGLAFYALALVGIIHLYFRLDVGGPLWEWAFPLLTLFAGYLGGWHFPLANRLFQNEPRYVGRAAGQVYGSDLAGSAVGALTAGLFLVPVLGVSATLAFVAVLNVSACLLLAAASAGYRFFHRAETQRRRE